MDTKDNNKKVPVDSALPWGVYIPPLSIQETKEVGEKMNGLEGYVRIMDKRGKSFQCGYSCSVKSSEAVRTAKRSHDQISSDLQNSDEGVGTSAQVDQSTIKPTDNASPEERLHPEEALFLQMRGILRVESRTAANKPICNEQRIHATMSTPALFNKMLPECNISLTAYLVYAHLREQGYILMRYTKDRIKLLRMMVALDQRRKGDNFVVSNGAVVSADNATVEKTVSGNGKTKSTNTRKEDNTCTFSKEDLETNNRPRSKKQTLKSELSDDVAHAPPPCVLCNDKSTSESTQSTPLTLAYLAYNPNAHFKRTNPGIPNFGVAVMSYSHGERGPTFDVLSSLVSLCQGNTDDCSDECKTEESGFPLRIMTVSDSGAVVAFGVTDGDVPVINHRSK
jgi:hypothetical protein